MILDVKNCALQKTFSLLFLGGFYDFWVTFCKFPKLLLSLYRMHRKQNTETISYQKQVSYRLLSQKKLINLKVHESI